MSARARVPGRQPENTGRLHSCRCAFNTYNLAALQEIALIPPVHSLGALSLDTQPLKYSLRSEASNWKVAFSKTIHKSAAQDLQARLGGRASEGWRL